MNDNSWKEKRSTFRRDGFVRLGRILEREQALKLGDSLAPHVQEANHTMTPYGVLVLNMWQSDAACAALIAAKRLDRIARKLLEQSEVILFQDLLIWKQPKNASRLQWHQDYSYWPLEPINGVVVWIALDDINVTNGCMHFVRGTHLDGELQPTPFADGLTLPESLSALSPIDFERADREGEPIIVQAGEATAHDTLVWHMSPANKTEHPRRAWATMWTGSTARWDLEHAPHPYTYTLKPTHGDLVCSERFPIFTEDDIPLVPGK